MKECVFTQAGSQGDMTACPLHVRSSQCRTLIDVLGRAIKRYDECYSDAIKWVVIFICLFALEKIVPNVVQLVDCHLDRRDKEPLALTLHESVAIKRLKCSGNLEIKFEAATAPSLAGRFLR